MDIVQVYVTTCYDYNFCSLKDRNEVQHVSYVMSCTICAVPSELIERELCQSEKSMSNITSVKTQPSVTLLV